MATGITCKFCGRTNEPTETVCVYCGQSLVDHVTPRSGTAKVLDTRPEKSKSFESKRLQNEGNTLVNADHNMTLDMPVIVRDTFCPYCREEIHSSIDKFCLHCGSNLQMEMERCRGCKTPLIPHSHFCHMCGMKSEPLPGLRLHLFENSTDYAIPRTAATYVIGRSVPQQDIHVDLDLGPYGQRKISRQHARFVLRDGKWYLEDMNSKAGTRVYNRPVEPFSPLLVEDGMVIYFADLKVKISLS